MSDNVGQVQVTTSINLYDSDILKLDPVMDALNQKQGKVLPLESFRSEILERFYDAGFKVDAKVFTVAMNGVPQEGLYGWTIEILDRVEKQAFDFDKMAHEVTSDVLDLGTKSPPSEK